MKGELALLLKALAFASLKHRDQRRKDAEASPYINHPIALADVLVNEGGVHPARLVSVLHYDGSPIYARFIIKDITEKLKAGQATLRENAE